MTKFSSSVLVFTSGLLLVSCGIPESDGRKYHTNASPVQSKMGVSFTRVRVPTPPVDPAAAPADVAAAAPAPAASSEPAGLFDRKSSSSADEPPGLFDMNGKPDEPGAKYWMHGQQSANPVMSKMGVRVERRKK